MSGSRTGREPAQPASAARSCDLCGNRAGNRLVVAREMMFGLRDEFAYLECCGCGCLQRIDPVADPARYYPPDYHAFERREQGRLTSALKRRRLKHALGGHSPLGGLLARLFGVPVDLVAVARAGIRPDESVLDVGCGRGWLLRALRSAGFRRLAGVDPYLPPDAAPVAGLELRRCELAEVDGSFDWVMLHHSFEHMPSPAEVLLQLRRLLRPGGRALIRVPLADSHAFRTYGRDWVQLDAPRHLYLHTRRGLRSLAEANGFGTDAVIDDSTAFQFWGSEQYRRDIPLCSPGDAVPRPHPGLFSRAELRGFARRAATLNRSGAGDQAIFVFTRV